MKPSSSVFTNKVVVTSLSIFITIMPRHRLRRWASKSFLLSGCYMSNNDGYASLPSRSHDDVSNNSPSLFFCIACGFHALDYPGLQYHLEGSLMCYETIMGKKQRTATTVLSPRSLNQPSTLVLLVAMSNIASWTPVLQLSLLMNSSIHIH